MPVDFSGKRVTVMGLGRFGGGIGVTRWLAAQGADLLVTDLEPAEKLADSIREIQPLIDKGQVQLRLGEHNVSDFTSADLIIANPAVPKPWDNRFLRAAKAAAIPITTEIELALQRIPRERTIGITGTAGKSTTSALIAHILQRTGTRVRLGGNIGGSLLEHLDTITDRDWFVLELSSFMLHWLGWWSPHAAVITNIADNHLDWHGTFDEYARSKQQILDWQQPGDIAVLADRSVADWPTRAGVDRIELPEQLAPHPLRIPGTHNQRNAAAAVAAITALNLAGETAAWQAAATFPGLPHRLELVAEIELAPGKPAVRFYNDSKSTTPEATSLALDALGSENGHGYPTHVHLIAGGYDKGARLYAIASRADLMSGIYTIGATGDQIADLAETSCGQSAPWKVFRCQTLQSALATIKPRLHPGDVVLLSPGCASWDQFANYEERGQRFTAEVRRIFGA